VGAAHRRRPGQRRQRAPAAARALVRLIVACGTARARRRHEAILNIRSAIVKRGFTGHLGWFANWALNRDRACDPSVPRNWAEGFCSSVAQQPYDFTKIVAQYGG
jgi:hypothetical protein